LPHELAATNICELLDLGGIPVLAADRTEADPIVIAGGPCAYNPEPYALFFDAIQIGEGEESTPELLYVLRDARAEGKSRAQILRLLAQISGVYVPSLYEVRPSVSWGSVSETEGASGVLSAVRDSSLRDESLRRSVPSRLIHAQAEPALVSMCSEPPSTPSASLTEPNCGLDTLVGASSWGAKTFAGAR
jgi:hypothetical protein